MNTDLLINGNFEKGNTNEEKHKKMNPKEEPETIKNH